MEITLRTMTEEEKVGLEPGNLALLSVEDKQPEDLDRLMLAGFIAPFIPPRASWIMQCNPKVLHREDAEKRFLELLGLIDSEEVA